MYTSITFLLAIAASVQAANNVPQKVTYTAAGASAVTGNGFGCAHITPAGQGSQLGCVKHVFTDGFTVGVTNEATKKVTLCSIAGTSGACGPAGVNVAVDLTGGTGTAPAASGPEGTTTLTAAELVNKPIRRRAADMWAEARSVEEELEDYE
ncbi:hypothetical protein V8E51_013968 [Hyaloscypha variabilis]|uniref:Uncharacterized protein n=1 Tax=Hyaloscypha variabilis (strain UAMH 11265 / GT02V1 / F) TaxID=1149755 RepID=A0A2J6RRT5_HYAVF|nr:hypothetical protein L207DRAFT_581681 [Hyaloscypha variabilis F]